MNARPILSTACFSDPRSSGATSGFISVLAEKRPANSLETFGSIRPTDPSTRTPARMSGLGPLAVSVARSSASRSAMS